MKLATTALFATLISIGGAIAQEPAPNPSQTKNVEVTGCLTKSGDNFMLTSNTGDRLEVMGTAGQLNPHTSHEVKITGEKAMKDGKQTLSVSKVEMIAAACITKS